MKNYQGILFDLDGTLLDTSSGVIEAVRYAIISMDLPEKEDAKIERFVGPPMQDSFIREYGLSISEAQRATNIFRDYYSNTSLLKANLYSGVLEVLKTLCNNQCKIAVATYKRHDYAIKILKHFGISQYCDFMQGADNNNVLKKSDIINNCINELGLIHDEIVLIGDSEYDAIGAKDAGVDFIGVTYGYGFRSQEDLEKYPNVGCVGCMEEILKILNISNG